MQFTLIHIDSHCRTSAYRIRQGLSGSFGTGLLGSSVPQLLRMARGSLPKKHHRKAGCLAHEALVIELSHVKDAVSMVATKTDLHNRIAKHYF